MRSADSLLLHAADVRPDPRQPLAREFDLAVHPWIARTASEHPDAVALHDARGTWTYAELMREADSFAAQLLESGLPREAPVAIFTHRSAALAPAVLGVLRAGGAFALLDPSYPPQRLAGYVEAIRPFAFLAMEAAGEVPREVKHALDASGCRVRLAVAPTPTGTRVQPRELPAVGPDDLAYLAFTSGTTGQPKAILGVHAPLPHFLRWHQRTFGLTRGDHFAMLSGLAHDPLLRDLFTPLTLGASLHVPPPEVLRDPEALRAFLNTRAVTAIHLTPSLGQLLCHGDPWARGETLPSLRHAFFAGERLQRTLAERFTQLAPHAHCVNFYGATETPQAMGYHVVGASHRELPSIPIGRGIDGVQLLVLQGERLAQLGETGEVLVRTPYLTRGYLDAQLTDSRFITNPFTGDPRDRLYRTGDLGRYLDDGELEFCGRADHQLKIRGFRVELEEIEAALHRHPQVRQAAVVAHGAESGDARLVGYARTAGEVNARAVREFLATQLPDYMVPRELVLVDAFPLTPNGKIDRAALPAPSRVLDARTPPRNELERRLAGIWERALDVRPIGVEDTFFELGGESLVGLALLAEVEQELGARLPVSALITAPTVAQMARLLDGADAVPSGPLVPLRSGGARPAAFWLPGGGGVSAMAFREIAQRLGDRAVYGLEAERALERAPSGVPAIAARYLDAIRARQPRGPYHLLGFSLGSFVAYEMAVQLRRAGEEPGVVAVFDTSPSGALDARAALRLALQRAQHLVGELRGKRRGELAARLRRIARNLAFELRQLGGRERDALLLRLTPRSWRSDDAFAELARRNIAATYAYAANLPRYEGTLTVFLANDELPGVSDDVDPRLGWRRFARTIEIQRVPGNHLSVLQPPHVDAFAAALRARLDA